MKTVKEYTDKVIKRIIKQLKLPQYIQSHLEITTELDTNKRFKYCIKLNNTVVSTINADKFYTHNIDSIRRCVDYDIEQHILKVYASSLNT